ncbi:unnamed protein product [Acanthoscelides obtectus]|uniref:Uncharacterized protein n=1 Tax=Acanthoscelides obtectus TaxID=200917 RepID=A0A9P0M9U7_ACAOB|nr:unnamed protein product [Acanthoscelides obtectus]CAK1677328.1 hypothetical protein AOBTE_LOCUS31249 [Acanthoscelides obtectus]
MYFFHKRRCVTQRRLKHHGSCDGPDFYLLPILSLNVLNFTCGTSLSTNLLRLGNIVSHIYFKLATDVPTPTFQINQKVLQCTAKDQKVKIKN